MEKICKRCNFRTPASRQICQVCGHAKFVTFETPAPAVTNVNQTHMNQPAGTQTPEQGRELQVNEIAANFVSRLKAFQSNLIKALRSMSTLAHLPQRTLGVDGADTPALQPKQAEFPRVNQADKMSTIHVANANYNFPEGLSQKERLDAMLSWFKSYGVDTPLILEHVSTQSTELPENSIAA